MNNPKNDFHISEISRCETSKSKISKSETLNTPNSDLYKTLKNPNFSCLEKSSKKVISKQFFSNNSGNNDNDNLDTNIATSVDNNVDANVATNLNANVHPNLDTNIATSVDTNVDANVATNLNDNVDNLVDTNLDNNYVSNNNTFDSEQYYNRNQGQSAQRNNISAAKLVAQMLKTTLGPKGMDKMIVDEYGNTIITNDGATILSEMILAHPVARMIAEMSKNQEKEIGDGTTTIAILTGELLSNAEKMLMQKIHPVLIIDGYKNALDLAIKSSDCLAFNISFSSSDLSKIAKTAMTGKGAEKSKELLSKLSVDSVLSIKDDKDLGKHLIKIISIPGENIKDSILFNGVVLESDFTSSSSPNQIKNSKIALIKSPLEIKESEIDAKIQITTPNQIKEFIDAQDSILKTMALKISELGTNVVFCQRGIDELLSHYLAELGISAIRRVPYSDLIRISKSTGAKIVSNVDEIKESDIGHASQIEKKIIYDQSFIFLEGSKKSSQTIIIRGANSQISDEIIRALDDAIGDLITLLKDNRAVLGAGAFELLLYDALTKEAKQYPLNQQIFINSFADAILSIPKTLSENAGFQFDYFKKKLDELNINNSGTQNIISNKTENIKLKESYGIGIKNGELIKPYELGIIEPYLLKYRAIISATELAIAILRIDDVIIAKSKEKNNNCDY